jgi:tRNA1(Val) A37 N6-methylase TrmN6
MDFKDSIAGCCAIETQDRLLGGRVLFAQPSAGYRAAIDPVLLAASVSSCRDEYILDAGCGTGAAALCLAARVADCRIAGVELNDELAAFARSNISANGFDGRIALATASFDAYAAEHAGRFDQVITNPPFYVEGRHTPSPSGSKAAAHGERDLPLGDWVKAAAAALRTGGRLTLIHRADRLDELFTSFRTRFGAVVIFPLWPRAGTEAKRVLVSAVKGRRTAPRLMPGLILHEIDGAYTAPAQAILRDAAALDLGLGSA